MKSAARVRLRAVLDGAVAGLPGVAARPLFGQEGYFLQGTLFALVFRDGRVGLRGLDASSRRNLLAQPGAEARGMPGPRAPAWVLLPTAWHERPDELRRWMKTAWERSAQRQEEPPEARVRKAAFRKLKR